MIEVQAAGAETTVQDVPGRIGHWPVGVPPSGPMDALSFRLANRAVDNPECAPALEPIDEIYRALVLGTRDYVRKNGFTDVVLGLSGGIDSSLVTAIAADAVGPEHVHAVALP